MLSGIVNDVAEVIAPQKVQEEIISPVSESLLDLTFIKPKIVPSSKVAISSAPLIIDVLGITTSTV